MPVHTLDRRTLLTGAGATAAVLGLGGLTACSGGSGEANAPVVNAGATLPTFVPYDGLQPDLPATESGVLAAFRNFPVDRPATVSEVPGSGQTITAMARISSGLPPQAGQNSYWAGLNETLGATLDLQMVPAADYTQVFATTIAGDDLPDLMSMNVVSNFPSLLDARFTPLDEYLGGDAVLDYPNLAALPTSAWRSTVYNGKIYGTPVPRGAVGNYPFVRQELFEAAGVSIEPESFEELLETAKALTDPKKRQWAMAPGPQVVALINMMNGTPDTWAEEGGRLTNTWETEQFQQAVDDMTTLWQAGVIHPEAFQDQYPSKPYFNAGTVAINAFDGYTAWSAFIQNNVDNPDFKLGLLAVPQRDGGGRAAWHTGDPSFGPSPLAAIRKQEDPEKTLAILRVLNYLAAPFGTQEYFFRKYGEEGVDHTMEDGNPILTDTGAVNTALPLTYLVEPPPVMFAPGRPEDVELQHAYQTTVLSDKVDNPTVGLFSNTAATDGTSAEGNFTDGVNAIVQGRRPRADLDELISTWRSEAGDAMRSEYEEQLQTR